MILRLTFLSMLLVLVAACVHKKPPAVRVESTTTSVSFMKDVKPILDRRCVVCHSCYNAPCQLKLSSYEGLDRGGSKAVVYKGTRLRAQDPTRLFMDAHSTDEWQAKGFHSVTDSDAEGAYNNSVMLHLLDAKRLQPRSTGEYRSEANDLTCAADEREVGKFVRRNPGRGMPFGFPELSRDEFTTLATWLQHKAPGPMPAHQVELTTPGPQAAAMITKWEAFFNEDDAKHAVTARYLYEHLFLAHLSFRGAEPGEFYELVRSTTAPGTPIDVISTLRPYDDPGASPFFYRFRKIHSTIVFKTHMVFQLDDTVLARLEKQFIETKWLETPHRMGHDTKAEANPFVTYAQIPPSVRYQFLLDNSEYIIRTFIRGPVCKGQIALNVIHDHFWVMFLDPEADPTVQDADFLVAQAHNLTMPIEKGSSYSLFKAFSNKYRKRYADFYRAKGELYDETNPEGLDMDAIWRGEESRDAPALTIYRHFDSATVHKGFLGNLPRTLWVIDFSQLERIYYSLVAGFDVFGDMSHQLNVRRYMDYLRIEGELNFLEFLPREDRVAMLQSWYIGDRAVANVDHEAVRSGRETGVTFETDDPKREFVERLVDEHFIESTGIAFDEINYTRNGVETPMPTTFETHEDVKNGLRALTAPGTGFIRHVNKSEANVLFVRVRGYDGSDRFFSIVINRWHDNVNALFKEQSRLDATKDTIDFFLGSVGAYPNYFLDLAAADIPDFFDMMQNFDGSPEYVEKILKYGVNRADPEFWAMYDWFQERFDEADPLHTGLYDLNRYYPVAIEEEPDGPREGS